MQEVATGGGSQSEKAGQWRLQEARAKKSGSFTSETIQTGASASRSYSSCATRATGCSSADQEQPANETRELKRAASEQQWKDSAERLLELGCAGRSRQRNNNGECWPSGASSALATIATNQNNNQAWASALYSKIFAQYLPSSFNLNHTLGRSGGGGGGSGNKNNDNLRKKKDENKKSRRKSENKCSSQESLTSIAREPLTGTKQQLADDEDAAETETEKRQRPANKNNAAGCLRGNIESGAKEREFAFESDGQSGRDDRGKIESSRSSKSAASSLRGGFRSLANVLGRKLRRRSAGSGASASVIGLGLRLGGTGGSECGSDSLSLYATNADQQHQLEENNSSRKDGPRRQTKTGDQKYDNELQVSERQSKTKDFGLHNQTRPDCDWPNGRERQLESVLETRRRELQEQLKQRLGKGQNFHLHHLHHPLNQRQTDYCLASVATSSQSKARTQTNQIEAESPEEAPQVERKGFLHLKSASSGSEQSGASGLVHLHSHSHSHQHLHKHRKHKHHRSGRERSRSSGEFGSESALILESDSFESEESDDLEQCEQVERAATPAVRAYHHHQGHYKKPPRVKARDSNNNDQAGDAANLLINLSLEKEQEEEEQDDQVFELNTTHHRLSTMPKKQSIEPGNVSRGSQVPAASSIRQRPQTSAQKQRKRPAALDGLGSRTSLLIGLLTLLLLCLLGLSCSRLVAGQHQHQTSPFARSQGHLLGPSQTPSRGVSPSLTAAVLPPTSPVVLQPPPQQQLQQQPQQQQQQQQAQPQPQAQPGTGSLVANINCNKIRGHVTLTPNLQGGTTVTTQITAGPPGEVYQWSIHQFPIKPGAAMCSCSSLILGSKLIDLSDMHGNLPSDQEFSVQSSLALFGDDSPIGRSLLLRGLKTGMVACGTFLPTSRKSNYRAKFHTPLSGSVTIFQTAFGTSFLSHLMYSNGTRRHSMHRFDILKTDDDLLTTSLLNNGNLNGAHLPPATNLNQIEQREHEHELQACKRLVIGGQSDAQLFKNLTYQLSVSTENFGMRGRTALVLPPVPFETFSSVYVVVYSEHDPMEPMACAPLRFVKPKTAAAKFQTVSVQGQIVFQQDSPYDVTVARVALNFPNSDGHSYGIDELPMIIRRKSDTRVCPNIREIIYNPHHIEPSSVPPEGEATSDQYAVGDLSGKYGSLTGKQSEKITVSDHNLPLFGPVSIIGRALTIYSADGMAIACSNVELTSPMTTAFATFDFGIQGQFIFRQQMNDCNGDTYVYIEVSKPTGSASQQQQQSAVASLAGSNHHQDHARSLDHNWHIHERPVDSGLEHLSTTECSAAGNHFNPYNASTSTIYSRDCTPFNVLRCELGDLSSKMFTIEIPPYKVKSGGQEPDIGKFFGTDIDLPLCGPVSIVNRSVVVHVADFGSQRLACSTVIEFKPRA